MKLVTLLAAAGLFACAKGGPPPSAAHQDPLPAANRFSRADLDPRVNACVDFAAHANGKWLAANPIPSDRTSWGSFELLIQRSTLVQRRIAEAAARDDGGEQVKRIIGDLWKSGMDEARINALGITPLHDLLAAIDAIHSQADIAEYLRASFARGDSPLFDFGPDADYKRASMTIAYVSQGGLSLPDKGYYFDADKQPERDALVAHVARVLELSGVPAMGAARQAREVMAFETRLARVSRSSEELARDSALAYNPVSPTEADKLTPNFAWTRFFDSQGLRAPERFSLAIPEFHQEVSKMLADTPVQSWQAYLRFHLVDGAAPYLSDPFVEEDFAFYDKTLHGQKEMKPRWKRVLDTINAQAGDAMGQLYVRTEFPPEAKARMEVLVENLRQALRAHLETLTWMSPATKKKALEKWATFSAKIGYPDKWRDYAGLRTRGDSYLGNVSAAAAFNYRWRLSKIGTPVDRAEWGGLKPQTVNANYQPLRNEIKFPAAILQPPFFDPAADDATNYGGIGAVIGHEMTHGYDDQGSRFGASGNFENWWTEDDARSFAALTDKLVTQFDAYEVAPGKRQNGKLTLGENIADLGGLAIAYDAMKKASAGQPDPMVEGLTRDQRFFYNWATVWRRAHTDKDIEVRRQTDPHALAVLRAFGAPSNMPAFIAAFGCKPGDAMVRSGADQIKIW